VAVGVSHGQIGRAAWLVLVAAVTPILHSPHAQLAVQTCRPVPQRPQSTESPGWQTPCPVQDAASVGHWQVVEQVMVPQLPQFPFCPDAHAPWPVHALAPVGQ
jgi:hypothetical protein